MNEIKAGDVIQIDPEVRMFGGCLALVDEVKGWGVLCGVRHAGEGNPTAYVRLEHGKYERIGSAVWAPAPEEEE